MTFPDYTMSGMPACPRLNGSSYLDRQRKLGINAVGTFLRFLGRHLVGVVECVW